MNILVEMDLAEDVILTDSTQANVTMRYSIDHGTGPLWGPGASCGRSDLAFNILASCGLDLDEAADLHEQFALDLLSTVPPEGGRIARDTIRYWIALQRACPHTSWEDRGGAGYVSNFCLGCGSSAEEVEARKTGRHRKRGGYIAR